MPRPLRQVSQHTAATQERTTAGRPACATVAGCSPILTECYPTPPITTAVREARARSRQVSRHDAIDAGYRLPFGEWAGPAAPTAFRSCPGQPTRTCLRTVQPCSPARVRDCVETAAANMGGLDVLVTGQVLHINGGWWFGT